MQEIINCPSCQRRLQVPETLMGQDVQCPTCGATFVAALGGRAAKPAQRLPEEGRAPRKWRTRGPTTGPSVGAARRMTTAYGRGRPPPEAAPRPGSAPGQHGSDPGHPQPRARALLRRRHPWPNCLGDGLDGHGRDAGRPDGPRRRGHHRCRAHLRHHRHVPQHCLCSLHFFELFHAGELALVRARRAARRQPAVSSTEGLRRAARRVLIIPLWSGLLTAPPRPWRVLHGGLTPRRSPGPNYRHIPRPRYLRHLGKVPIRGRMLRGSG